MKAQIGRGRDLAREKEGGKTKRKKVSHHTLHEDKTEGRVKTNNTKRREGGEKRTRSIASKKNANARFLKKQAKKKPLIFRPKKGGPVKKENGKK